MIKPEMVPPDAMYAAWKAMNAGMTLNDAIAAALNAWPEAYVDNDPYDGRALILPIAQKQEDGDGK